ncbi:MAG: hypothetical protein U0704_12055 [Candidatus Eisenbacteria bacterium]
MAATHSTSSQAPGYEGVSTPLLPADATTTMPAFVAAVTSSWKNTAPEGSLVPKLQLSTDTCTDCA